jgi:hypothetical protein
MTNDEARMTRAGINREKRQRREKGWKIEDDDEDDYERDDDEVRCASTA